MASCPALEGSADAPKYVLHYFPYSICSIMVCYTVRLGESHYGGDRGIGLAGKITDIQIGDQLEEDFLRNVNRNGQVPVLTSPTEFPAPMADSKAISLYLTDIYTGLLPESHETTLLELLDKLHKINFYALSFRPEHRRAEGISSQIEERLARANISYEYHEALLYKLEYHKQTLMPAPLTELSAQAEKQAEEFFAEISALRAKHATSGPWIFGSGPTVLDAHTIVFIARLQDTNRLHLLPEPIVQYASHAFGGSDWQHLMEQRATVPTLNKAR